MTYKRPSNGSLTCYFKLNKPSMSIGPHGDYYRKETLFPACGAMGITNILIIIYLNNYDTLLFVRDISILSELRALAFFSLE